VAVISALPGLSALREVLVSEGDPTSAEHDRQI
jgi:hypothetical protein